MIELLTLLGTLATLTVAGIFVARSRRPAEVVIHYFRCPTCHQKLRCAEDKVGRPGGCPRCKTRWDAPPLEQPRSGSAGKRRHLVGRRLDMRRAG
jgi:hypothetical protein